MWVIEHGFLEESVVYDMLGAQRHKQKGAGSLQTSQAERMAGANAWGQKLTPLFFLSSEESGLAPQDRIFSQGTFFISPLKQFSGMNVIFLFHF